MTPSAALNAGLSDVAKNAAPMTELPEITPGTFSRRYTKKGVDVYSMTEWNFRTTTITDDGGKVIFEQKNVEAPVFWSDLALNIVASKYFRGTPGTPARESSVRAMIHRVAHTISDWGRKDGYFATEEDAQAFEDELTYILLFQCASFNSPVWFNVGTEPRPQCSACFINSVEDSMESILTLAKTEGMLFKYGSGTGTNLSPLRSSKEYVKGGGLASGPVSFMKGYDAFAGVIKSGGKTRRAAKMVILNVDHPDILDFVESKQREEAKAHALIDAGYDGSVNGEAYSSVYFQNANHSVRVTDAFMESFVRGDNFSTRAVQDGRIIDTMPAKEMMNRMAKAAHGCGDPGVQFDDVINKWHTCKGTDRIQASNPCSEYMFLNDTACNLASINLMKCVDDAGAFSAESFRHMCTVLISAQEILVDEASYPTERIGVNSHKFRPLGLGYANLGALLMNMGIPYDSAEARGWCGAITAIMNGAAYAQSARIACQKGPFSEYELNKESMLDVMRMHQDAVEKIEKPASGPAWRLSMLSGMIDVARAVWKETLQEGLKYGYRNAQATVLAPTGTIAFMMDCDTTGIEPDIALVKYKRLSGGGTLKIVNQSVRPALERLGYTAGEINTIIAYVDEHETIEGAPYLKDEDLSVFDCAFRPRSGKRTIAPMGHVHMMAAAQPFLSGAISKTVNLPEDSTVADIEEIYVTSWKLGLKAVAMYRDGCKRSQPLSTAKKGNPAPASASVAPEPQTKPKPFRRRLPTERQALTHRFEIQGHEGYITVGMFEDGTPGEIFLKMSKEGSTISGLMDTIATLTSMALQYGVPLHALVKKFGHVRFEPSGFTTNPQIPMSKSIVDYTFRWLASRFLSEEDRHAFGIIGAQAPKQEKTTEAPAATAVMQQEESGKFAFYNQVDAPLCSVCGSITVRNASCYLCPTCGTSNGCS
ncbi:MAG: vitamin B12-dependent ribonucleotide reductase [Candidatus Hydrogenedentota bacterium]